MDFIPGTLDYRDRLLRHAIRKYSSRPLASVTHVAVHHSLTKTGSAESFARYHVRTNEWPGIGYHFVIEKNGTVKWCNDLEVKSYHVGKSNSFSVGICMVGDFRVQSLEEVQLRPLIKLLKFLKRELAISNENIWGHNEFQDYDWKECPCVDMSMIRSRASGKRKVLMRRDLVKGRKFDFNSFDLGPEAILDPNFLFNKPGESVITAANRMKARDLGEVKKRNRLVDVKKRSKVPRKVKIKGPIESLPPRLESLIRAMDGKGFRYFSDDSKPFNLNIVGLRSQTDQPNRFDDEIWVFWKYDNTWTLKTYKATADPGLTYLNDPINDSGTAILKEGQYLSSYRLGKHRNRYEALVQAKPVTVIRDFDRDSVLDYDSGKEQTGFFGINIHRATAKGESQYVNKWSAGCQVFARSWEFKEFIQTCNKSRSIWGNSFTYTLLSRSELSLSV